MREDVEKRLSHLEKRTSPVALLPEIMKRQLFSDVPAFNQVLSHVNLAVLVDKRMQQADLKIKVGTFLLASLTLFASGVMAGFLLHWPLVFSLAFGALLLFLPNAYVNVKRRLRIKKFTFHFPDALEMFARSLRAGHSFSGSIELVAQEMPNPVGPEFQKVFDEQNLGVSLREALIGMMERIDSMDVKFLVTAILIHRETGGNLAEIIDKISYVIRERFRIQGQLKIFTAQARLTGLILALLPVGAAFLIGIMNPGYLKPLWHEEIGRILVFVAVFLQIAGLLVIRRIVRIKY
jgi:tight adherence protein B